MAPFQSYSDRPFVHRDYLGYKVEKYWHLLTCLDLDWTVVYLMMLTVVLLWLVGLGL